MEVPSHLRVRLPAEWEPQEAVWLSWPVDRVTWPNHWNSVQETFAEIALVLSRFQKVYINIAVTYQADVAALLEQVSLDRRLEKGEILFFDHPVDDVWVRDHGPIFVTDSRDGSLIVTDWIFNGWGEKFPFDLDNLIPRLIARTFGYPCRTQSMVVEGGAIEGNGAGDLLVTTDCLLNRNRNPDLSKHVVEEQIRAEFNVERIHWLDGCIEGDDTDGHIDNLVRFFSPAGLLVASTDQQEDANYPILASLIRQCEEMKLCDGESPELVPLPLPPARYAEGRRLPMSYLNFYIANDAVLMPTFDEPKSDDQALETLSGAFPGREIVPIDCQELILEGGALHCLTQQVPQTNA